MSAKPLIQCFQDDIFDIVDKYYDNGGLSLGEAIGALELVKLEVYLASCDKGPE